nr:PREDICTED: large neutral amino acids transporter small subunit 4-like [Latimeria chalumnae]|eukprot:XP_006005989.2 PREDICTED: large neutral amino acids transporter small subunit 4-like [Latimeria chalumnae]
MLYAVVYNPQTDIAIYTSGIPFIPVILVYGGISCLTFINCFFSWSVGTDTAGKENSYSLKLKWRCCDPSIQKKRFFQEKNQHFLNRRYRKSLSDRGVLLMSSRRRGVTFREPTVQKARHDLNQSLLSPVFILNLSIAMVTQVWTHFYMGSFHTWLQQLSKDKYKTDMLSYVFGTLQMLSLLSAPAVSLLLGSRKHKWTNQMEEQHFAILGGKYRIKQVGTLKNLILTFTLNSLLLTAFGVVSLIPHLELQVGSL